MPDRSTTRLINSDPEQLQHQLFNTADDDTRSPKRRIRSRHGHSRCRNKRRYREIQHVKDALLSTRYRRYKDDSNGLESNRNECRYYFCRSCQGWHLTSRPDYRLGVSA
jgi:hypothetical protein